MIAKKTVLWIIVGVVVAIAAIVLGVLFHRWSAGAIRIKGAVIRSDDDSRRELPISDVEVTASDGTITATTQSNASGYFNIPFRRAVWPRQSLVLSFRHPGYEPLDLKVQTGLRLAAKELYVAPMIPLAQSPEPPSEGQVSVVSNIRVRYTINSRTEENIGSAVKSFQVINKGNVACNNQPPCSPDGLWKASRGSASLDAGPNNTFRNVRASCIAGPCPFTRIDSSGFVNGGQTISASALSWSDTATFLLEAEVFHTAIGFSVRELYPVVFGRALNFTLPPTQEGVSIEADIDKERMVFPLGPELYLSWATCTARTTTEEDKTTVYRCELKPGYKF